MELTIAITSCNRLLYTRALINSLQDLRSAGAEIVLVDNCSSEPGLSEYLTEAEGCLLDKLELRTGDRDWINDEYIARNKLIEMASKEVILFMQDDSQFIGTPQLIQTYISDFLEMNALSLSISAVRKSTLNDWTVGIEPVISPDGKRKYWMNRHNHFPTTGLFKAQVFRNLGSYPTDWEKVQENWGRSEDHYDKLITQKYPPNTLKNVLGQVPVFPSVWNDPRGGYAFIRENIRYGHYLPPPDPSGLYYEMMTDEKVELLLDQDDVLGFIDVAVPLGWEYAKQPDGDQLKYGQHLVKEQGPTVVIETGATTHSQEIISETDDYLGDWLESDGGEE
jgi:glycosyltransferase involved in cell wall biosynthesis